MPTTPPPPCTSISVIHPCHLLFLSLDFAPQILAPARLWWATPVSSLLHLLVSFLEVVQLHREYLSTSLDREWSWAWLKGEKIFLWSGTCLPVTAPQSFVFLLLYHLDIFLSLHWKRNWNPALALHMPCSFQSVFTPSKLLRSQSTERGITQVDLDEHQLRNTNSLAAILVWQELGI